MKILCFKMFVENNLNKSVVLKYFMDVTKVKFDLKF